MWRKKPKIQVISIKHETRTVESGESTSFGGGLGGISKTKKIKECTFTIVLLSRNGELCTREFNGTWDLSDIKKWEDL